MAEETAGRQERRGQVRIERGAPTFERELPHRHIVRGPNAGDRGADVEGTCRCIAYNRGRVTAEGVIEATATFRVVTVDAIEVYAV